MNRVLKGIESATKAAGAVKQPLSLLQRLKGTAAAALLAADIALLTEEIQDVIAYNAENDAYAQELKAIGRLNAVLAGRYTGGQKPNGSNGGNDDDCKKEWENARDYCSDLEAMPRNSPEWKNYINVWGGNLGRCIRGQVSERCGGNRVN